MRKAYSQQQIERTQTIIRTVGDEYNLLILFELMYFGEKSFNELKRMTDINAVTLTRKLRNLEDQGYLSSQKQGKEVHYQLTSQADELKPLVREVKKLAIQN